MTLTGNTRYKRSFLGKMILEIEYVHTYTCPHTFIADEYLRWRDATLADVQVLLK